VMLGNLLRNACSHTETGTIDVRIERDQVSIRDTGVGMSAEQIERAFDPFYRREEDGQGGMGIGLSIVRRLGERFDWPVTLHSAPGQGTTAIIQFAAAT